MPVPRPGHPMRTRTLDLTGTPASVEPDPDPTPVDDELYVPSRLRQNKVFTGLRNAFFLGLCAWGVNKFAEWYSERDTWLYYFILLAIWRYARFVLNCIGWLLYKPVPLPSAPTYTPNRDVTVILPTIDPTGVDFQECIRTCCQNEPAMIIVITAGDELLFKTKKAVDYYTKHYPKTDFIVDRALIASKRAQVAVALPLVKTPITVMLDDHVFWKKNFLRELLAPFENPEIGLVGTNKKVRRLPNLPVWRRIWNMLGATYLYRHNFEVRSANYWDGGAFVISARTCALRTRIVQDPEYLAGYVDERFFFGLCGPLNPDDDNYITRFAVRKGWRIKFQYTEDAEIETTVGVADPVHKKFLGQCTRWARTTWRSNPCSLFTDGSVWAYQPYCVYAVYLTSFTNFALFTDAALFTTYRWTTRATDQGLALLIGWIIFVKFVKIFEYYKRHPQDIWTFPVYLVFAYYHSIIKLWALGTFYNHAWTGRNLEAIKTQANPAGTEAGATAGAAAVATNLQRSHSVSSTTTSASLRAEKEGIKRHMDWLDEVDKQAKRLHKSQELYTSAYQIGLLQGMTGIRKYIDTTVETQKKTLRQQKMIGDEIDKLTVEIEEIIEVSKTVNANEILNQEGLKHLRGQLLRLEQKQREILRSTGSAIKSPPLSPTAGEALNWAQSRFQPTRQVNRGFGSIMEHTASQTGRGLEHKWNIPTVPEAEVDDTLRRPSFLAGRVLTPQEPGGRGSTTPRPKTATETLFASPAEDAGFRPRGGDTPKASNTTLPPGDRFPPPAEMSTPKHVRKQGQQQQQQQSPEKLSPVGQASTSPSGFTPLQQQQQQRQSTSPGDGFPPTPADAVAAGATPSGTPSGHPPYNPATPETAVRHNPQRQNSKKNGKDKKENNS